MKQPARPDPLIPADEAARTLARRMLAEARHAALASVDADGRPWASRISLLLAPGGEPVALVSELARHTVNMRAVPMVSLLLGEPGPKGDPLVHPRLTLVARARFIDRGGPAHRSLAELWRAQRPKATLWLDLPDFRFVRFTIAEALLNAGFGRACRLTGDDLRG